MGSLRRRLLGWLLAATAILGLLALADTWREAVTTATRVSDRVLTGSALAIAERVTVDEDTGLQVDIPYSALEMLTSTAQDRVFYRVDGPLGYLTGYRALTPAPVDSDGRGFADGVFAGDAIRVITLARTVSTGVESIPFAVTVAESTLARRELARSILIRSALRLTGMIGGAALIVWIAVPLALRPLNRLSDAIAIRSPDDLSPIRDRVPTEVQGLVEAVNSFMARLGTALDALRNFTGNASHQLRTPLAVLRTQMALASRADTPQAMQSAVAKGDAALAHAERVLTQLLLLARIDAAPGQAALAPVDLAALARGITGDSIPRAADAGIDLGFDDGLGGDPAQIRAEPVLLAEALANLIDNAIAYAGRGAMVTVSVRGGPDGAILAVIDDGPGIPADARAGLGARFARGGTGAEGLGLGLAIVAEIAALFGGRLALLDGPGGRGLRAELHLPMA
ncbi:sensor histidine kinase [Paracoccus sediminis]|uniref:histidine kinase n=1 Tax=Paracoccus sediminis TaxID=1214787 RepID=A0A238WL80_9RHOB|nr:sensor histidine kinase [Paracoccus sediminis]TBN50499.1 sensor histidine kinase [Paracoccus sediminis]SNR47320.1 two-component system, OmpR family, sensor histidine kinase TctE [Paracoccus sediminis]